MKAHPPSSQLFPARDAAVLLLICVLLFLAWKPTYAQASNGRIAFLSDRDGSPKLYTMQPDGTDVQLFGNGILEEAGTISSFAISPDGSKASFISQKNRDGTYPRDELFLLDLVENNVIQLTQDGLNKANVIWLSDSSLAYLSGGPELDYVRISRIALETGQIQIIADSYAISQSIGTELGVSIRELSISPDHQQLVAGVHTSLPEAYDGLVVMGVDGTNIHQVTPNNLDSFVPIWSMDPNIVYFGCGFEDNDEICQMNLQTSESQVVTDFQSSLPGESTHYIGKIDVSPANLLLFQLYFSEHIYSLNPDDGSIINITEGDTSNNQFLGWINEPVSMASEAATNTPADPARP